MTHLSISVEKIAILESGVVTVLYSDQSTYEWASINDYYEWCSESELKSAFETLKYKIASAWVLRDSSNTAVVFDLSMDSGEIITGV